MNFSNAVQVITLLIALIGVVGGLIALRQGRQQQRLELGAQYLERYWQIDDDLLSYEKGSREHHHARHRYLRFCEDEFEAARNKWFNLGQWNVWHSWLTTEEARTRIGADLNAFKSAGDGFEYVTRCLSGRSDHSWSECPANPTKRRDDSEPTELPDLMSVAPGRTGDR